MNVCPGRVVASPGAKKEGGSEVKMTLPPSFFLGSPVKPVLSYILRAVYKKGTGQ